MQHVSILDDTIENLTVENAKLSDKAVIQAVLDKVTPIRENEFNNAIQMKRDALDSTIKQCNDLLKAFNAVEETVAKINALPDSSKTETDDEKTIIAYETVKTDYDALSEHSKELVGNENKAKLDAMIVALTAYMITKGGGKSLSFAANGSYSKFTYLEINGKKVAENNYTAVSGSAIITLKASYLETLGTGKRII